MDIIEHHDHYRIVVKPRRLFTFFRTHKIREGKGSRHIEGFGRGKWNTCEWLISKEDAHIEKRKLVPDKPYVEAILNGLKSVPELVSKKHFEAKFHRSSKKRPERSRYEKLSRKELYEKAKKLNIKDRSKMSKKKPIGTLRKIRGEIDAKKEESNKSKETKNSKRKKA